MWSKTLLRSNIILVFKNAAICTFYNSTSGCKYGSTCRYLHDRTGKQNSSYQQSHYSRVSI